MQARIIQFPHRLREVPTQEIRSLYEDLYRQQQEEPMKKQNDPEFDYKLWWWAMLAWDGLIAFLVGYVIGGLGG